MRSRVWTAGWAVLLAAGCSGGSSGGGAPAGQTAAPVTSSAMPAASIGTGPLAQKAQAFEALMDAWHLGLGQVQDVNLGPGGVVQRLGNAPSRCLWTGIYAGAEALRYRATGEPDALRRVEVALQTLHDLHEITGSPGLIARGFDDPAIETHGYPGAGRLSAWAYNRGTSSRDQYSGWFYGVGLGWDLIQDPQLKAALAADVRAVCDTLIATDLSLEGRWGPQGQQEVFFNLRPDYFYQDQINAQGWAQVDDFPLNLITKKVPYDPLLADAIKQATIPPIRAGEALRAVFFFTVAEHVTGDPRYGDFKRQLLYQRGYLQIIEDYATISDDILYGRNLAVAGAALRQLLLSVGQITSAYLQATGRSGLVSQVLVPLAAAGLSTWIAQAVTDALAWIHDPNNAAKLQRLVQQGQIAAMLLGLAGQPQLARQLTDALTRYGPHLNHQGLVDLARTVRSHLGANLTWIPLSLMLRLEQDPVAVAGYRRVMEREWAYLAGDHNALVNLIHAGHGLAPGPRDLLDAFEELSRYPVDMTLHEVDNSAWPGLVVSPWPDRFGRVGNIALVPDYFPIDQRAPDVFPWRGHPRQIKSGSNVPQRRVAPLGYLAPYWIARELGFLSPAD